MYAQNGYLRGDTISDTGGAIAPNTVIVALISGNTFTVSGAPQLVVTEPMGFIGCSGRVNNGAADAGGGTPAIFTTTLGSNGFPTSIKLSPMGPDTRR